MGKKTLIFVLAGFVGLVFVSTVYCSFSVNEYLRVPFQKRMINYQTGANVVGVGPTPSAAIKDGIKQISQLFGRHFISSETVVREGILERDLIIEKGSFRGSKLDRFYEGVFCRSNEYFAVFRFSSDFIKTVKLKGKNREKGLSKIFVSFDAIAYSTVFIDSFGEEVRKEWIIKVPRFIKRFFDFFIWHTEDIGNIEFVTEDG